MGKYTIDVSEKVYFIFVLPFATALGLGTMTPFRFKKNFFHHPQHFSAIASAFCKSHNGSLDFDSWS